MPADKQRVSAVLKRAIRSRCPQCGIGKLFYGWNKVVDRCPACGCELDRRGGGSWFFTYLTTAFLTGLIVLFMLFYRMPTLLLQQIVVAVAWLVLILLTLPLRKSIGIAIDFLIDIRSGESVGTGNPGPSERSEHPIE